MRIVHVEDLFYPTAGYQVNFLARYNVNNGNEVVLITSDSTGGWGELGLIDLNSRQNDDKVYEENNNVKVIRLKCITQILNRYIVKDIIRRTIELRPDIVLVHGLTTWTGLRFLKNLKKINCPVLFDTHMVEAGQDKKTKRFIKFFDYFFKKFFLSIIIKNNIKIICLDNSCKQYIKQHYNIPDINTYVSSWGCDVDSFRPDTIIREKMRKMYNLSDSDKVLVYTGKFREDKKVLLLAKAIQKKFEINDRVAIFFIGGGNGDYNDKVQVHLQNSENLIFQLPMQNNEDLPKFFQMADLAVWPGGCSLSYFEAQSCGVPVIVENILPNIERIIHNNGLLFEVDDYKDLRCKIMEYFNMSKEVVEYMKTNSRKNIIENYSWNKITYDIELLFNDEISNFTKSINRYDVL